MTTTQDLVDLSGTPIVVQERTMELQISRRGRLQQKWRIRTYAVGAEACVEREEWRDVPRESYP